MGCKSFDEPAQPNSNQVYNTSSGSNYPWKRREANRTGYAMGENGDTSLLR